MASIPVNFSRQYVINIDSRVYGSISRGVSHSPVDGLGIAFLQGTLDEAKFFFAPHGIRSERKDEGILWCHKNTYIHRDR